MSVVSPPPRTSAVDPWSRCTARRAPCPPSPLRCRAPSGNGWTIGLGAPVTTTHVSGQGEGREGEGEGGGRVRGPVLFDAVLHRVTDGQQASVLLSPQLTSVVRERGGREKGRGGREEGG